MYIGKRFEFITQGRFHFEDGGIEFGNEKKKKIVASNEKVKV